DDEEVGLEVELEVHDAHALDLELRPVADVAVERARQLVKEVLGVRHVELEPGGDLVGADGDLHLRAAVLAGVDAPVGPGRHRRAAALAVDLTAHDVFPPWTCGGAMGRTVAWMGTPVVPGMAKPTPGPTTARLFGLLGSTRSST